MTCARMPQERANGQRYIGPPQSGERRYRGCLWMRLGESRHARGAVRMRARGVGMAAPTTTDDIGRGSHACARSWDATGGHCVPQLDARLACARRGVTSLPLVSTVVKARLACAPGVSVITTSFSSWSPLACAQGVSIGFTSFSSASNGHRSYARAGE